METGNRPRDVLLACVRRDPVTARISGPSCGLDDAVLQEADPLQTHLLHQLAQALVAGDLDAVLDVDAAMEFLDSLRSHAALSVIEN